MSIPSSEKKNMSYQRMSSSSDCSDEDDGKQPSSLLEYWDRIRPSSTDEDSEPEVSLRCHIPINQYQILRQYMYQFIHLKPKIHTMKAVTR